MPPQPLPVALDASLIAIAISLVSTSPRPERKKSPAKTAAILESAMSEFLANGYASTSMDRIAASAGVSKATVYSHFQDKSSLFSAIIQHLANESFQTIFEPDGEQPLQGDPHRVLKELAQKILTKAEHNPRGCEFMRLIIGESGRFPELAQPYVTSVAKPLLENLTGYFQTYPELNIRDPEATARVFVGTLVYFVMVQQILGGETIIPIERKRIVTTLVNLIIPNCSVL